jgi:hypothetical protein
MALSASSAQKPAAPAPAPVPQQASKPTQQTETITCPLTGEQIPSCCCPVTK